MAWFYTERETPERQGISSRLNGVAMKKQRKSEEKHVGTSGGTRMEERVARDDVRGILFEIQRDVNILLYIEPERQSEKVSPGEMR